MASPAQWTWVWANSGRWWRTGKPGVLHSRGSWRVRQELAAEQQTTVGLTDTNYHTENRYATKIYSIAQGIIFKTFNNLKKTIFSIPTVKLLVGEVIPPLGNCLQGRPGNVWEAEGGVGVLLGPPPRASWGGGDVGQVKHKEGARVSRHSPV